MQTESRQEQFEPPSVLGNVLRKLHIDIPLFIGLLLTSLLSFVILYSTGSQDMDVLMRQGGRVGLAFLLMTVLAHVDPYQFKRYSTLLFGIGIFLLIAPTLFAADKPALKSADCLDCHTDPANKRMVKGHAVAMALLSQR